MRPLSRIPIRLAIVLLLACGGDDDESDIIPVVTGDWIGMAGEAPAPVATFELSLTQTEQAVSGTGSLLLAGTLITEFTVDGTNVHPDVRLTITAPGYQDAIYDGEFTSNNVIRGTLTGSGFDGEVLTIDRR